VPNAEGTVSPRRQTSWSLVRFGYPRSGSRKEAGARVTGQSLSRRKRPAPGCSTVPADSIGRETVRLRICAYHGFVWTERQEDVNPPEMSLPGRSDQQTGATCELWVARRLQDDIKISNEILKRLADATSDPEHVRFLLEICMTSIGEDGIPIVICSNGPWAFTAFKSSSQGTEGYDSFEFTCIPQRPEFLCG